MAKGYYGNAAGPASKMYAYVEFRTTTQEEGRAWVQLKRSCLVEGSGFGGTVVDRSWGSRMQLYGPGWYGDSGWVDYGWVAYGGTARASATVSYTGASGAYYASSVDASYSPDVPTWQPRNVSGQRASRSSDTRINVSWTGNATVARPYDGVYVDRSVDGGPWSLLADKPGTATSHADATVQANHAYRYRILPHNSAGNAPAHQATGEVQTSPSAPTQASASRSSDSLATVSFASASAYDGLYQGHRIERSVNGGSWSLLANVPASSRRHSDSTVQPNASYRYRVRSYNAAGASPWRETGTIYNTPAAPGKPALARTSDTSVRAAFANPAATALSLQVQRRTPSGEWGDVASVAGRATSFEDSPGGGTFLYRIRNVRGTLASAWSYSDPVVTICPPSAPTVTSPASSQVIPASGSPVTVRWRHNAIDGSAQSAAQVRVSTDSGSAWSTEQAAGAQSAQVGPFPPNVDPLIQVRTKGAHADYGPWSAALRIMVRQEPTVVIEEPAGDSPVSRMPMHVRISYADASGSLASATLIARGPDGSVAYERDVTGALEFDLSPSEWLPANGATYALEVQARSSSTLGASATRAIATDYALPSMATVDAVADRETGHVSVIVREARSDGAEPMDACALYRAMPDGSRVLVADGLSDGELVVDRYAPLNVEFAYETASVAASGAVALSRFPMRVESDRFYLLWGDGRSASAMYSATDELTVTPDFEAIRVAGRRYPIVAIGTGLDEPHALTATRLTHDEAMRFAEAARSGSVCVLKTLYGEVFRCVAVPKLTPTLGGTRSWSLSLDVTRVDGDAL